MIRPRSTLALGRAGLPAKATIRVPSYDAPLTTPDVGSNQWWTTVGVVAADLHPPGCSLEVEGASYEEVAEFTVCHAGPRADENCDDEIQYEWRQEDDGLHLAAIHIHCTHQLSG